MQIEFFNFFRSVVQTEDGLVLYALALIVSMEIIDFLTGTIAAIANPDIEYKSKIGINGLLRKNFRSPLADDPHPDVSTLA